MRSASEKFPSRKPLRHSSRSLLLLFWGRQLQYAQRMDQSESHARDYLEHLGLGRVVYQPDGNVPPDFLVDGRIAVEVRRLNENELTESCWN